MSGECYSSLWCDALVFMLPLACNIKCVKDKRQLTLPCYCLIVVSLLYCGASHNGVDRPHMGTCIRINAIDDIAALYEIPSFGD